MMIIITKGKRTWNFKVNYPEVNLVAFENDDNGLFYDAKMAGGSTLTKEQVYVPEDVEAQALEKCIEEIQFVK